MNASQSKNIKRRETNSNVWLASDDSQLRETFARTEIEPYKYEILASEEVVGSAMLEELKEAARAKNGGDLTFLLLGGRGAQAMYREINRLLTTGELSEMLARLHVFTQDALAPVRMENGLSFVRDFERLLDEEFFKRVKSFTPIQTDTDDLESELVKYLEKFDALGGIDLFFLGLGPRSRGRVASRLYQAEFGRDLCRRCGNYSDFREYSRTSHQQIQSWRQRNFRNG